MNNTDRLFRHSFKRKILTLLIPGLIGLSTATDAAEPEPDEKKLTIVGSHIKRSTAEGPSPVQVIDRNDIVNSGLSTLQQLFEKLPSAGSGSFSTRGNSQDSTGNGGAAISLRGFGADATLVLINGRRANISAFAESVVNNFVDINSIPLAAIERIDILKDGASAIYGSDAISGVVNIILRKDFEGKEISVGYGSTTKSNADETTINAIFGFGDDNNNATFIFDYFNAGELRNADRGRIGSANQTSNGGYDLRSSRGFPGRYILNGDTSPTIDPDCPADRVSDQTCLFDYGPYGYLIPESERAGAMFMLNSEINSRLEMYIEASVQRNTSEAGGAPTPLDGDANLTAPALHPNNPFGVDLKIDRHRTVDANPRIWDIQSDSLRFVSGLKGVVMDFDWDISFTKARGLSIQSGDRSQGWVRTDFLQREINAGRYNPFGGHVNSQSVIDSITTSLTRRGESRLTAYEGSMTGDLFSFSSGTVAMAAGFEYRQESVEDIPDDQFQRGLIFGTESVSAAAERDHWSVYTEFAIPVIESLELQLAARYDDYEFAGTSTNPKVAFHWTPLDSLAFRASWGTGFRAPSLAQIGLGPSQDSRFFSDPFCSQVQACINNPAASTDLTINFSGNADLKPEESETWNVGVIWDITNDINVSFDYWDITQDEKIDEGDVGARVRLYCNPAAMDNQNCVRNATTNELLQVSNSYENIASQEASGIDISANYQLRTNNLGEFKFGIDLSYLSEFEKNTPETQDSGETIIISRNWTGEYEYPEYRWNARTEWAINDFTTSAIINYIGEFQDQPDYDLDGTVDFGQFNNRTVDSMITLDVQTIWQATENLNISLGASNLLDEETPFAAGEGNNDLYGYVQNVHDPRGRFIYSKITVNF